MGNLMADLIILRTCIKSICLVLCLCAISRAAEDPSLVLYFDFEEGGGGTIEDRSEYGNDGTIEGDAVRGDGQIGKGLEIDVGSFVLVPDSDEIEAKIARGHAASVEPEGKLSTVWAQVKSQY